MCPAHTHRRLHEQSRPRCLDIVYTTLTATRHVSQPLKSTGSVNDDGIMTRDDLYNQRVILFTPPCLYNCDNWSRWHTSRSEIPAELRSMLSLSGYIETRMSLGCCVVVCRCNCCSVLSLSRCVSRYLWLNKTSVMLATLFLGRDIFPNHYAALSSYMYIYHYIIHVKCIYCSDGVHGNGRAVTALWGRCPMSVSRYGHELNKTSSQSPTAVQLLITARPRL